jgi:hypothetical protein
MEIMMVVLTTAFFLLGFFSIFLRFYAGLLLGGLDEYARRAMGVSDVFMLVTAMMRRPLLH